MENYRYREANDNNIPFMTQMLLKAAKASGVFIEPEKLHEYSERKYTLTAGIRNRKTALLRKMWREHLSVQRGFATYQNWVIPSANHYLK